MNGRAKLYFDHFIKQGYNQTEFSQESIHKKAILIFPELLAKKHRLPAQLRGQRQLKLLSRELAEISIVVKGYAMHRFKLYPSNDMLGEKMHKEKSNDDLRNKDIGLTAGTDIAIDNSISFLSGLIKTLWVNGIKQKNISLIIGDDKVTVPEEIKFQTVGSLMLRLKRLKTARHKGSLRHRKSIRKQLFNHVEQSMSQYLYSLNFEPAVWNFQATPLITAIVLLAAGYLQTVEDYRPGNKKTEMTKYHSYSDLCAMQRSQVKMKYASGIRSLDLPVN